MILVLLVIVSTTRNNVASSPSGAYSKHGVSRFLPDNVSSSSDGVRQAGTATNVLFSLDFVFDAIMTNGASLLWEEGRWYNRLT